MPKNLHLTMQDRNIISTRITEGKTFRQIGLELDKDPGTISREVKLHRTMSETGYSGRSFNPCVHRKKCRKKYVCKTCYAKGRLCNLCGRCIKYCDDYEDQICPRIEKPPYVCNGCTNRSRCSLRKYDYIPNTAEHGYRDTLSESRKGLSVSPEELERLNRIVSPLLKQGQSIHHIRVLCDELTACKSLTIRGMDQKEGKHPLLCRFNSEKAVLLHLPPAAQNCFSPLD